MKLAIACDHRGFEAKRRLLPVLQSLGHKVEDFGCHGNNSVDYPDHAAPAARAVAAGNADVAILLDGSGIGMSVAANKMPRHPAPRWSTTRSPPVVPASTTTAMPCALALTCSAKSRSVRSWRSSWPPPTEKAVTLSRVAKVQQLEEEEFARAAARFSGNPPSIMAPRYLTAVRL